LLIRSDTPGFAFGENCLAFKSFSAALEVGQSPTGALAPSSINNETMSIKRARKSVETAIQRRPGRLEKGGAWLDGGVQESDGVRQQFLTVGRCKASRLTGMPLLVS
jgi:hypothetical protein